MCRSQSRPALLGPAGALETRAPGRTGSQPPQFLSKGCVSLIQQGSLILSIELSFILFCSLQRDVSVDAGPLCKAMKGTSWNI